MLATAPPVARHAPHPVPPPRESASESRLPVVAALAAFALLYAAPFVSLGRDWLNDPDAGHGLLLAPLAAWLAWRRGIHPAARPAPAAGSMILGLAVALAFGASLAAEVFSLRVSMWIAGAGLVVGFCGARQLLHWWLPATLLALSVPLPAVILGTLALPLQLVASEIGAGLLAWRHVPVLLTGNVIRLPGQTLFVTEACSGLRSLSSLIALGVLIGGLWLRLPATRLLLVLAAIPVAVLLNGFRVFMTGFLVYYVDPALGEGFMHQTEGWIVFVVAFVLLGAMAWVLLRAETWWRRA